MESSPCAACRKQTVSSFGCFFAAHGDNSRREDEKYEFARSRFFVRRTAERQQAQTSEGQRQRFEESTDASFAQFPKEVLRICPFGLPFAPSRSIIVETWQAGDRRAPNARSAGALGRCLYRDLGEESGSREAYASRIYWLSTDSRYSCRPEAFGVVPWIRA